MVFHEAPATFVEQVGIKVSNLHKSIEFYCDVVGLKLLNRSESDAQLTADGQKPLLTLHVPDDVEAKSRTTGLYHFALLLPDRPALSLFLRHISKKEIELGAADHHVSEALYFNDPDGNGIEVYCDRDENSWIWQEDSVHMVTEALDVEGVLSAYNKERPWTGIHEDTVMGHLHLHVKNIEEALRFYKEGLGMSVVSTFGRRAAFLSFENYHHHIAVNTWNGENAPIPSENSVGLKEYVMKYPSKETLTQTAERLTALGFEVHPFENGFYSKDASGNKVFMTNV